MIFFFFYNIEGLFLPNFYLLLCFYMECKHCQRCAVYCCAEDSTYIQYRLILI